MEEMEDWTQLLLHQIAQLAGLGHRHRHHVFDNGHRRLLLPGGGAQHLHE
jgi:hypothetical protein